MFDVAAVESILECPFPDVESWMDVNFDSYDTNSVEFDVIAVLVGVAFAAIFAVIGAIFVVAGAVEIAIFAVDVFVDLLYILLLCRVRRCGISVCKVYQQNISYAVDYQQLQLYWHLFEIVWQANKSFHQAERLFDLTITRT